MILGLMIVLLGGSTACNAETQTQATTQIVDAGNKFCPVSGDKVTGKHFVEYNGKRYGLCCPMCANKFKRDPERYLKKMVSQEMAHDHHH